MAQLTFTLNLTINAPAPPPFAEGATSGDLTLTQGVDAGNAVLTPLTGGVPPYSAAVDPTSPNPLAPGLSVGIDGSNNLILSGTPTANSQGQSNPVLIDVSDSLGNQVASIKAKF